MRVGLGTDKPPYIFENQARGLEYEVVTGALTAAGLDFRVQHAPPERLERMFLARQIDALTTVTARSNPDAHLSAPYLRYRNMAVALAVRQLRLETIADLQHYSISAFQRARLLLGEEYYQMTLRNPRYREEARQIARNRLLYSGRVEVAVGDPLIFAYLNEQVAEQVDTSQPLTWYPLFPPTDYQMGFQDAETRDRFDAGLARLRASGEYQRILDRYRVDAPAE